MGPATGGSDALRTSIPASTSLAGVTGYVQAAIVGARVELCNALDVTIGYY